MTSYEPNEYEHSIESTHHQSSIQTLKPNQHQPGNYQTAHPTGVALLPIMLKKLLVVSHSHRLTHSAILCDPNVLHIRSSSQRSKFGTGDWAWGCGYRNIQMIFSTLIVRPAYQQALSTHPLLNQTSSSSGPPSITRPKLGNSDPQTEIPSIRLWQQIIEDGWKSGFDPEGAAHFSRSLIHSTRLIFSSKQVSNS